MPSLFVYNNLSINHFSILITIYYYSINYLMCSIQHFNSILQLYEPKSHFSSCKDSAWRESNKIHLFQADPVFASGGRIKGCQPASQVADTHTLRDCSSRSA